MSGERCLVIGGGLIGSRVAAALSAKGLQTTVLSRSFNPWLVERVEIGLARDHPGRG